MRALHLTVLGATLVALGVSPASAQTEAKTRRDDGAPAPQASAKEQSGAEKSDPPAQDQAVTASQDTPAGDSPAATQSEPSAPKTTTENAGTSVDSEKGPELDPVPIEVDPSDQRGANLVAPAEPWDEEKAQAKASTDAKPTKKAQPEDAEPKKAKQPPPNYAALPQTYHLRHIDVALGPRLSSATHDGLQPYMYEPLTGELVGRVSATVVAQQPWALSVLVQGSGFSRSDAARGVPTSLFILQMGVGLEARYHFHHRAFAYGRLVAGAERAHVEYGDQAGEASVYASAINWAFFGDANLGAAFRFAGSSDGRKRVPRAWVFVEGGGRFASSHKAELEVDDDGPNRADPVILPNFATNGAMVSGGAMISF